MITYKTAAELEKMRRSGLVVYEVLQRVREAVAPGKTTWDLEEVADRAIQEAGAVSAFRGYQGYPCVLCTSVNEQVVHGIPSRKRVLEAGDIVSVDCGVVMEGYYGDSATTVAVGGREQLPEAVQRLLEVTETSLMEAIEFARVGNHLGDVSSAVQKRAEDAGFGVVREFVGHGIGTHLHEDPQVPNYGRPGTGPKLREGMVLAIEPMINEHGPAVKVLSDGWTAVTVDGGRSAHFEHTVAITANGPWILTRP